MAEEGEDQSYDEEAEPLKARSEDLSRRKKVRDKLLDAYKDIQQGYTDQFERSTDIQDFWDLYNGKLGPKQFYQGNAQIFVPIVYEALKARKTRFVNQLFPMSGRHIECASSDGTLPQAIMALGEHYIRKAHCRSKVSQLILNGDVEGQYTIYVNWAKHERHVVERIQKPLQLEEGEVDEEIEDIREETIAAQHPDVEVIADADFLVLPFTADTLQEALDMGGSITILRRWTKDRIEQLIDDDEIDSKEGKALIKEMAKDNTSIHIDKPKAAVGAAGVKADGRGKYTLAYETWSMVKTPEGRRLCRTYFGGPEQVLSCKRNPDWADRLPVISEAVEKVQGSFKGRPPVKAVADLQIFANDMINEAADSASFSMLPIIMSDPDKNPRVGSMVLSLAAVWLTSPNDTQFAKFPDIWKEGLGIVAAIKQEIFQALSVNPAMITQSTTKKKLNQAEIAQEQQVDLLTTSDAATILEGGILTPMVARFIELDHQYRDKAILVRSFGDLGLRATMQEIPQIQMDHRYEFRWYGVEAARTAQQIQQQIAGLNVIRGIPPQAYQGYKLNLAPAIAQMMENLFGPRLAPLIFQDMKSQLGIDPKIEVEMAIEGIEIPVNPLDNHAEAMKLLVQALQQTKDPSGVIRVQILKHQQIMIQQAQAQQQQALQGQGQPGGGGGPKPGAQPAQATGGQGPPGMIHQDQIPQGMPRRAA